MDYYSKFIVWWTHVSDLELLWLTIGFSAQGMFMMRFIVQWIASEKAKKSIMPELFWYFSLTGGLMLFSYGIYRLDPVIILGQLMGIPVYLRNLQLIWREKRASTVSMGS